MEKSVLILGEGDIENIRVVKEVLGNLCGQNVTFFSVYCYDKVLNCVIPELVLIKKRLKIDTNIFYPISKQLLIKEIPNELIVEVNLADIVVLFNSKNKENVFNNVMKYAKECNKELVYY